MSHSPSLSRHESEYALLDGTRVWIRPIRPEDTTLERNFVDQLSDRSRYLRFMYALKAISPEMVSRFTRVDYTRDMALIALTTGEEHERQIAVARFAAYPDGKGCEFAIVVADAFQGKGLASELLRRLIDVARERHLEYMDGQTLRENPNMIRLARELGFEQHPDPDDPKVIIMKLVL
jgi:acetyltransferase